MNRTILNNNTHISNIIMELNAPLGVQLIVYGELHPTNKIKIIKE